MKRAGLIMMLLVAPRLFASTTTAIALAVNETRQIRILGVTAAWAVDTTIVDAAVGNGGVTLFGRSSGRTRVMVIGITGENALDVVVEAKPNQFAKPNGTATGAQTLAEVRYSSATREVQNNVIMTREENGKRTQLNVRSVHQTAPAMTNRPTTSLPYVSYGIFTGKRELTFLDRDVVHSPLTLYGTQLRGIHYLDDHWRVHAGYTAYAAYQSFLVPVQHETVAGAAYAFRTGARSTVTPGLFVYRGQGTVASLLYDYKRDETALRAELGVSNGVGGAVQFWLDSQKDQARVDIRYRPRDFAVVGPGDMHGLRADANWNHAYGRGSNAALSLAAADLGSSGGLSGQRVLAASADVDQRVNDNVSLLGGVSWGSFGGTRTLTVPVGVNLHSERGNLTALYRYAESGTNRGGHGGRLAARTSIGRMYLSAYVDRQQNAPTLDVIFGEHPELALALSELGITATSPADVARALREHAALVELGFIEGVTVDFAPTRTLLGFEAAWLGTSDARHQLRARLLHNVVESVASRSATTIASLTYSRRISAATDLFAGYTYWRIERRGFESDVRPYVEVGVRHRFDGVPFSGGGSGTISGVVFADEDIDGTSDGTGIVAEVDLDGANPQKTDADGRFAFRNVPRGSHRVTVRVARAEAYFTTPSRVEARPGDEISFGVATTPAHVIGRVANDAGRGIGGVRVMLSRGTRQILATTDSEGTFTTATAPGEWEVSILGDSVPAGHSLAGIEARSVMLDRGEPRRIDWQLRALRSVNGQNAPPNSDILIEPLGKRVRSDAEGRFAIRSLPAGEMTIIAGSTKRTVVLAPEPTSLTVDFQSPVAIAQPEIRTVVSGEIVVQIGAFRVRANAEETLQRARRSGVDASLRVRGGLTIVSAGPYATTAAATKAAATLTRAGLEAVITPSRK